MNRSFIRALFVLLLAGPIFAQSYTIAPPPFLTELDNNGLIVNGGCIWTYTAGTTTPATTYADTIGTPNSNPIIADSTGRFTAFLVPGTGYKFVFETVCTPPAHGAVLRTADQISGVLATASVTGFAQLASSNTFTGAQQSFPGGSVAAPALAIGSAAGIYSAGANNLDISAGATSVLQANVSFITSPVQPFASAYNSAAETIATATFTGLVLDTDVTNIGGMHSVSVNNTRMTAPTSGIYLVNAKVSFVANATGQRILSFFKNGGGITPDPRVTFPVASATVTSTMTNTLLISLSASDYIEAKVYQDSGGNLNTDGDSPNQLSMLKVW